ncbi:Bug family tripartite tricarboxylate transporter substrate binding protein [Roseococcus sp. YIM B11640]|uniref:Bug family tripartite tricarboxylate transporter substrate binding protein n=1 Tax=Roseococcus sp. YIM B11640 TaxID=3133973 RepID=UPI003C79FC9E
MQVISRRALIAAGSMSLAAPAIAQSWSPSRTVTLLIPFAAGGATDVMGRLIAGPMTAKLGQSVVVENMAGGSGQVAAARVARSAPDGHTLLVGHIGVFALNPHLFKRLTYDPVQDFSPVGLIGTNPMVLLVSRQSGITSIAQLRERARNGRLTVGSSGVGTTLHLGGVMTVQALGGAGDLIPYRGGGPAINDLHAGVLDVVVDQAITAIPATQGGARALAVTGTQRLAQIPDVPTAAEAGMPTLDLLVWNLLAAPRGTPREAILALSDAVSFALEDETLKQRFATYSAIAPRGAERGPEAAAELIRTEGERWGRILAAAGIEKEG